MTPNPCNEGSLVEQPAMGMEAANWDVYQLLKDGVLVSTPDLDQPSENDWLAVNQLTVQGDLYPCIPDLVCFVNGVPWWWASSSRPVCRHA